MPKKKKTVSINDMFIAVLVVLCLMLGTLVALSTTKVNELKDKVGLLEAQIERMEDDQ